MSLALIKKLHEERTADVAAARALLDTAEAAGRSDLEGDEQKRYESLNEAIGKRDARIADLLSVEERESRAAEARERFEKLHRPDDAGQREQDGTAKSEVRDWFAGKAGKGLDLRSDKPVDFRALSKLSAGAGANTVKTSFLEKLYAHLIEVSGILKLGATVLHTDTGESLQIPRTSAHAVATIVGETGVIPTSEPTFGQATVNAFKYAVLMQTSNELLTDTSVDLEGYLAMQAGRAVGNAFGQHAMVGTGAGQPAGLVPAATVGKTGSAGVAGVPTSDDLIDLYFSVIEPYRASSSCGWAMKDATLATIRKFKGSDGQYLWQPSYQAGTPDTILGKPVVTDPFIPAAALGARSVLFGDYSQYVARLVNNLRLERSDDFAFNSDVVTWRCIQRADGVLVDQTGAIKTFVGNAA